MLGALENKDGGLYITEKSFFSMIEYNVFVFSGVFWMPHYLKIYLLVYFCKVSAYNLFKLALLTYP